MGWSFVLQYILAISSDARALSQNIDSLLYHRISNLSLKYSKINIPGLTDYPDYLALVIIFIASILLVFGIKESSRLNKIINFGNVTIVFLIIIFGFLKADLNNWLLDPKVN